MRYRHLLAVLVVICSCTAALPCLAVTMFVSGSSDGSYLIEADDIGPVRTLDIHLEYDAAALADPKVSVQGGSLTDCYRDTPGTLLFSVDRGETPAGTIEATVEFTRRGSSLGGGVISVSGAGRDAEGKGYDAQSTLNPVSDGKAPPVPETPATQAQVKVPAAGEPAGAPLAPQEESDATGAEPAAAIPAPVAEGPVSVLDRFRRFRGTRGEAAFAALFSDPAPGVRQEPAVALSDGKSPVRLTFESGAGGAIPAVAVAGGKVLALERKGEKGWGVSLLPDAGQWQATLTAGAKPAATVFPVTVAPPAALPNGVNESNFLAALEKFVAESGVGI